MELRGFRVGFERQTIGHVSSLHSCFNYGSLIFICFMLWYSDENEFLNCLSSLEKEKQDEIYMKKSLQEIKSHNYGGLQVLQPTVYKLETQESQCCNSVQLWRPENQEHHGKEGGCPNSSNSAGKYKLPFFLQLFFSIQSPRDWMMPPTLR